MSRPSAVSDRRAHPFYWIAVLLAAFSLSLHLWTAVLVYRHGGALKDFGWEAAREGEAWVVRSVRPDGPAASQLAAGDRIQAINGDARVKGALWLHLNPIPAGASYSLRVVHGFPGARLFLCAAPGFAR